MHHQRRVVELVDKRSIILALQICQQWVLRVVPTRVALERVAAQPMARKALEEMMCYQRS